MMYLEYKVIDGILHYRTDPKFPWHVCILLQCAEQWESQRKELVTLRAENERLREANRWIPVSERLPECLDDIVANDLYVAYKYTDMEQDKYFTRQAEYWLKYGWVYEWKKGTPITFKDFGNFEVVYWRAQPDPPTD